MSETLYPHEQIVAFLNANIFRITSMIVFMYAGMVLTIAIYTNNVFDFCFVILFILCGIIFNRYDYKLRGLK